MATIQEFILRFKTQGKDQLDKASAAVKNLSDDVAAFGVQGGAMSNVLGSIISKLGPVGAAAGAAAGAVGALTLQGVALADAIIDISDATGISTGALNNFKQSLIAAGGSADVFEKFATKLSSALGDAATGNDKAQKAFKDLGVYVRDASGNVRDSEVVLNDVIAALAQIENPAIRAAKATELLGKEAAKIDWTNVNAAKDIKFEEATKKIDDFLKKWDKIVAAAQTKLVISASVVVNWVNNGIEAIANYNAGLDETEKKLNALGKTKRVASPEGAPFSLEGNLAFARNLSEEEKAFLAREKQTKEHNARMEALMRPYKTRAPAEGTGDYGAPSQAKIDAANESALRAEQSRLEASKLLNKRFADELSKIEIDRQAEIQKATAEIRSKEAKDEVKRADELAAKILEINAKAEAAKATLQKQNDQALTQQKQQYAQTIADLTKTEVTELQKVNNLIEAQPEKYALIAEKMRENAAAQDEVLKNTKRIVEARRIAEESNKLELISTQRISDITNEYAKRKELANALTEAERQKIEAVYESKSKQLELEKGLATYQAYANAMADDSGVLTEKQTQAIANHLALRAQLIKTLEKELGIKVALIDQDQKAATSFEEGWKQAWNKYIENARNANLQAQNYVNIFTRGFEDAFVRLVQTGKLSFKDLANNLIAEFTRIQARNILGSLFGTGGSMSTLFGGGRANGGPVVGGTPYMVGERGPEMFIPQTSGTIVPNKSLVSPATNNTAVTYNINAVDAASFRQMIARDPEFLYAVTQKGANSIPGGRR